MLAAATRRVGVLGMGARFGVRAMSVESVPLVINGQLVQSKATTWYDVHNPATNEVIARVPETTTEEKEAAMVSAHNASLKWREVPVQRRTRVLLKYQRLVESKQDELAAILTREQGKTLADAKGDVFRGLEAIELACAAPSMTKGEAHENLAAHLDTQMVRVPLGVAAAICPFNFPAMIPLWSFPVAIACGNAFVLKPSERVPLTAMRLVQLFHEAAAGEAPAGVLNVIHGKADAVNTICDHPVVKAVTFVGGEAAGRHIYMRASAAGKRAISNMAAKNHALVLPDADKNATLDAIVGAAFGACGQRCMALPYAIFVGEARSWVPELVERARKLKPGNGADADADFGPMISPQARARALQIVNDAVAGGAKLLLDGRGFKHPKHPHGYFLGPTILDKVAPGSAAYDNEIFGPVLSVGYADSLDEAIETVNANRYGNGCAIFTSSGGNARYFAHHANIGQIGVNVPIPVPQSTFSFTGGKASIVGSSNFLGESAFSFFTQKKTIVSQWRPTTHADPEKHTRSHLVMPTLG